MTTKGSKILARDYNGKLFDLAPILPNFDSVESIIGKANQVGVMLSSARKQLWANSPLKVVGTISVGEKQSTAEIKQFPVLVNGQEDGGAFTSYNPTASKAMILRSLVWLAGRLMVGSLNGTNILAASVFYALWKTLPAESEITVSLRSANQDITFTHNQIHTRVKSWSGLWIARLSAILEDETENLKYNVFRSTGSVRKIKTADTGNDDVAW